MARNIQLFVLFPHNWGVCIHSGHLLRETHASLASFATSLETKKEIAQYNNEMIDCTDGVAVSYEMDRRLQEHCRGCSSRPPKLLL